MLPRILQGQFPPEQIVQTDLGLESTALLVKLDQRTSKMERQIDELQSPLTKSPGQNHPGQIFPPRTKSPRQNPHGQTPGQNPPIIFYIQYPLATQILNIFLTSHC